MFEAIGGLSGGHLGGILGSLERKKKDKQLEPEKHQKVSSSLLNFNTT